MADGETGWDQAGRPKAPRREFIIDDSVTIGDLPVTKILGGRRIETSGGDIVIVRQPSPSAAAPDRTPPHPAGMAAGATSTLAPLPADARDLAPAPDLRPPLSSRQAIESIVQLVQINVAQHTANLEKARRESALFFKGMFVCTLLSVAIVLLALVLLLMNRIETGIVTAVVSALAQTSAALLFRKETELRRVIANYDDYIQDSQKVLTMIGLAETVEDAKMRDAMKEKIMLIRFGIMPGGGDPSSQAKRSRPAPP